MMRLGTLCAFVVGAALATALAPPQARAETDCEHLQRTMATLRTGAKVESYDIQKALATERSKRCNTAAPAAPPVARPPIVSTPAPMAPRPTLAANSGVFAGIPPRALESGKARCGQRGRPDPASQDPCDWFALAIAYQRGIGVPQNPAQALFWLEKAAKANHAAAQMGMGEAHDSGYGPLEPNKSASHHWMVIAANNYNVVAQRILGSYCEQGHGQPVDYQAAAYWYEKAYSGGEIEAGMWYGLLLANGKGVPRDPIKGTQYIRWGAEAGDPTAMYYLGDFYRMGIGVPFDTAQARFWLRKAQAAGDKDAPRILTYMDEVDRRYAAMPAPRTGGSAYASSGPSISDQAMETHRRQYRENCAAAAKGANRPCYIP